MSSLYHNLSLGWTGDYESLKELLYNDLKLIGTWDQPGSEKKVFKTDTSQSLCERAKV